MRLRSLGWICIAVGLVLLVLARAIDTYWIKLTEGLFAAALVVVGLGVVIFGSRSKRLGE